MSVRKQLSGTLIHLDTYSTCTHMHFLTVSTTLSTHPLYHPLHSPLNPPSPPTLSTHPRNPPSQPTTLSTHPLNPPSQPTLTTHPINPPSPPTLSTQACVCDGNILASPNQPCFTPSLSVWAYLGLLLHLLWTSEVFSNVMHVTTAGAVSGARDGILYILFLGLLAARV